MGEACSTLVGDEKYVKRWVGKRQRKRTLGRLRHKWDDAIEMITKISCEVVYLIELITDRMQWQEFVDTVMNLDVL
jgi:hypothetical protein